MNSAAQRLPAEAIPTDRLSPLRPISLGQSSHANSSVGSNSVLIDSTRNKYNKFEFEQGTLLEPQSLVFMPPVDQGNLTVLRIRLSHNAESNRSLDSTRDNSVNLSNSRITVTVESQQAQSSSTDLPKSHDFRPRLPPRDY